MAGRQREPNFRFWRYPEAYVIVAAAILAFAVAGPLASRSGYDPARVAAGVFLGFAAWMIFRGARKVAAARRAYDRARDGRCAECGYDLSGGVHRCPECGAGQPAWPTVIPAVPEHPIAYAVFMTVMALFAAAAIMLHTMVQQSGH